MLVDSALTTIRTLRVALQETHGKMDVSEYVAAPEMRYRTPCSGAQKAHTELKFNNKPRRFLRRLEL